MSRNPKLIKIPGPFMDAVKRLLQTAPPPKTTKDRKILDDGMKAIERMRERAGLKPAQKSRKRPAGTGKRRARKPATR